MRAGRSRPAGRAGLRLRAWRAAARRSPRRATALALVLGAALVGGTAWALLGSSLTALEEVTASGATRTDPAAVVAAAQPQRGTPLLRLDEGEVRARLADHPYVADLALVRHWPRGVEVAVTERVPVAAVAADGGTVEVLDADGAVITTAERVPDGVPLVAVDVEAAGPAALRAASEVASTLPPPLRAEVSRVGARSLDDVRLDLRDGALVRWGSAEHAAVKAQVLQLLRTQVADADGYDVSAPEAPATW